jgi:hypothetical protein
MVLRTCLRRAGCCVAAIFLVSAGIGPAAAAGLQPGEYACAGSSGILIGLGFKLRADGTYTDLDAKTSGRVVPEGSTVTFVGGHLAGQVGRNVRGGTNFEIGFISCSREHG